MSLPADAEASRAADTAGDPAGAKRCPKCGGRYPADFKVCPRDALPLEDAPAADDPLIGVTLADSYEIVREIGEGAMGRVYEARHTRLPTKRYAVKVLHEELAREPQVVTRFQREAEAASGLLHPNVVGVYDVNHTPDGRPYIVAEYLEGEELGDYLERIGKLPYGAAVHIVRQVCRALGAAHARGIVHRDVKPENIYLTGEPSAPIIKVLDFGISKVNDTNASLTKTGMVMGTPAYMAPEQARGDKVDSRADVYALGAILYRAVTGHRAFEGLDAMGTLTAVLVEEPPRPSSLEPAIPELLEVVIQRAMSKKREDRYKSMAELEAELASFDAVNMPAINASAGGAAGAVPVHTTTIAFDPTARTVLAGDFSTQAATQTLARMTREARMARPTIGFLTGLGWLWLTAALVDVIAAAIRWLGQGQNLTPAEVALTVLGALAATATPLILYLRFIVRNVWKSTPRAMEVAHRLRRTVLYSMAAFGLAHLAIRVMEATLRRDAQGVSWPGWALVEFAVSMTTAAAVWSSSVMAKPRV